ncbi:MAG: NAD(P)-dependent dehydrogenase (short-subunit alcohol dehydrogenase family) [Alcanivorax sp.]|jgi:NAD(P)-dependent dehydrogenase (short-subunit alcohol dehydrogenase family)
MTVLQESAEVTRPIAEAFDYVSDFTTTVEWDSTAKKATKITPGPIKVGTQFEVICALPVGSVKIIYRVEELQENKLFVLSGKSRFFDIEDRITFTATGSGTRITYRAEFFFKPLMRAVSGAAQKSLDNMGRESVASLGRALNDDFPLILKDQKACANMATELPLFTRLGYRRTMKRFSPMSASVRNKHIVITGANTGLGYATACELGRRGAKLTLVMRNEKKAKATLAKLHQETGNKAIHYELADLSLMAEVDSLVARLRKKGKAIDVLINNAGALFNDWTKTGENIEQSHALLLLSPYRLTLGLKPLLVKAGQSRVINVVSGGLYSQRLSLGALHNEDGNGYSGSIAYARQKRALMALTQEWAQEWAEQDIAVNAMHPGWADTPGVQTALPEFRAVTRSVLRSSLEGADTIVWMAMAKEAGMAHGKLFLDREARPVHLMKKTIEKDGETDRLMAFLKNA